MTAGEDMSRGIGDETRMTRGMGPAVKKTKEAGQLCERRENQTTC